MVMKDIKDVFSVSIKEGKLLYRLAQEARRVIVEIGSWKGYSTIWLANGSNAGQKARVYAIDTFAGDIHSLVDGQGDTYEEFKNNIAATGVHDIVVPIVSSSSDAVKEWVLRIDLLWIDGDHDDIEYDFNAWYPYLKFGGLVALHDTVYSPSMMPYKVAISKIYKSSHFTAIKRVGCLTYARKVRRLSIWDKILNTVALYRRYVYQAFIPYYTKAQVLGEKIIKRMR